MRLWSSLMALWLVSASVPGASAASKAPPKQAPPKGPSAQRPRTPKQSHPTLQPFVYAFAQEPPADGGVEHTIVINNLSGRVTQSVSVVARCGPGWSAWQTKTVAIAPQEAQQVAIRFGELSGCAEPLDYETSALFGEVVEGLQAVGPKGTCGGGEPRGTLTLHSGEVVLVSEGCIIGREADVYIPRPSLSRYHAVFRTDQERFELFDMASTNGLRVLEDERLHVWLRMDERRFVMLGELTVLYEPHVPGGSVGAGSVP